MKKFFVISLAAFMVVATVLPVLAAGTVQWNGDSDKAVAVHVDAVQNNTRKNASGPKITSNAHSEDFPGLYFIWDSKQKDNGYLKVDASVFDRYEQFTLTSKESNTYWDFPIFPQRGQRKTSDNCYVFFIPKVYDNKNINMVFIGNYVERKHDKKFEEKKKEDEHNKEHDKKYEDAKKNDRDKKIDDDRKRDGDKGREQDKHGHNDKKGDNNNQGYDDKKRDDGKKDNGKRK